MLAYMQLETQFDECAMQGDRVAGFCGALKLVSRVMWRHEVKHVEHEMRLTSCSVIHLAVSLGPVVAGSTLAL